MLSSIRGVALLAAVPVLLVAGAGRSAAQGVIVTQPVVRYYYSPPVTSYYAPPVYSYYSPPVYSYYSAPAYSYYSAPVYSLSLIHI